MSTIANQPLAFQGELDAEEGSFACTVDRFIVNGSRASIQMTCDDDGGPHTAEGTFELEGGHWRTRSFSVRYKADGSQPKAIFRLISAEISADSQSADLKAEWEQAGDDFSLEGTLERFQA